MSAAEVGMYLLLLCYDWNEKGIEWVPEDLARFCRVSEADFVAAWDKRLKRCFVERDGRWWNPRLEREREKQEKFRQKQVAAGLASAAARLNHGSTDVQPRFNSPFPSPAPATTGGRKRQNANGNGEPEPYRPPPFCTKCGEGWGKERPSDLKLVPLHKDGCPNAE